MIDVNQITSTLRGMPDQQLQRYAMMHKGDPYILALAVAESNQRKQLRQAAQARNVMPQPKVADAAIAGMAQELPEDQGIAQIPAPNIQGMADGGIAGYGDGDDVPRKNGMAMGGMYDFAQRSEPVLRMSGGGHIPRYQGNTMDGSVVRSNPMFNIPGFQAVTPRDQFTQAGAPENQTLWEQISSSLQSEGLQRKIQIIEDRIARGIASPEEKAYYAQLKAQASGQPQVAAPKSVVNPDEAAMAAEKAARFKPTDKAPADKTPNAAPAPVGNLPTNAPSIKQAQDLGGKFFDLKGIKGTLEQQEAQERQDILNEKEARAAKLAAFNKEQGPAMAGYEKLLKSEEMQDATDKEKAGLMSLMKGFLAMAAGESPNAATNIAKGAMVGLGDYGDALKEFKKSAKERNKAMAEIENARRAEAKGDLKDQQASEDKANDYLRASKRHGIDAIINATGKSAEISAGIYKTISENNAAMARTVAQINAPDSQSKFYGNLGGGDIKKGLGYYAELLGPEAKGEQAFLAKYAGPQGEITLKMMETTPEGKIQAQLIRQRLAAIALKPQTVAEALP